jgi:isoamylase
VVLHALPNAYWEPLSFELPGRRWRRWIDTFLDSPDDIVDSEEAPEVAGPTYRVEPRSVVILFTAI